MNTTTVIPPKPAGLHARADQRPGTGRPGFASAVRSEFTKIASLRSTYWTLLAMIVACVGIGALFSYGHASQVLGATTPAAHRAALANARASALTGSLFGLLIGQLVIAVLGALTISSEYSTGMIRTTLTALPRRGTIYSAKATVLAVVALVAGLAASFASFFTGQLILSGVHASVGLSQPGVLRAVIGAGLFLAVCGLLSFGLGGILRHTAGAITAAIGLLFVTWILSQFLPGPPSGWLGQADIDKWIPFNAGGAIWEHASGLNIFSAWTGFAVFCGYAAVALAAGLALFLRRDA